jgi:hypothetical protein
VKTVKMILQVELDVADDFEINSDIIHDVVYATKLAIDGLCIERENMRGARVKRLFDITPEN